MHPRRRSGRASVAVGFGLVAATVLAACSGYLPEEESYVPPRWAVDPPAGEAAGTTDDAGAPRPARVGRAACSTGGIGEPAPQPALPEDVERTRDRLIDAALSCDVEVLAALAGPAFTSSLLPQPADPETWEELDDDRDVLAWLVTTLGLPPDLVRTSAGQWYVWPAAAATPWEDVDQEVLAALAAVYPRSELARFDRLGAFMGYRVAIEVHGGWRAFDHPAIPAGATVAEAS